MNGRSRTQSLATAFGLVFLALGILGFLPGLTTDYGDMSFAGDDSGAELLGVFRVSMLASLLHLGFGVAGLVLARTPQGAKRFLLGGGAIVLALGVLGFAGLADWLPSNTGDDWLHAALGAVMIGGGVLATRGSTPATA